MPLDISQRWFAWAMPRLAQHYDNLLADRKRALLSVVGGTIVELGPGTGTNFRYYPPGAHWIGIEPNPYLPRISTAQARRLDYGLISGNAMQSR